MVNIPTELLRKNRPVVNCLQTTTMSILFSGMETYIRYNWKREDRKQNHSGSARKINIPKISWRILIIHKLKIPIVVEVF
jgi:hypothetical protein